MAKKNKSSMLVDNPIADKLSPLFMEILKERIIQDKKWGEQNHPMLGDGKLKWFPTKTALKSTLESCQERIRLENNWFDILMEEVLETFLETSPEKQREEMIQVAAVAVAIIEQLDRQIGEGAQK